MKTACMTILAGATVLGGCSFAARSAEMYRDDTRELLTTRNTELTSCYAAEHEKDPAAKGLVVVAFELETDTGKIANPRVVEDATTAPEPLQKCVLDSLDGLALSPGDARKGEATFTWEFAEG